MTERRPEYPSLGKDGLLMVRGMIAETARLPPGATAEQVLAEYARLFDLALSRISVLVGSRGVQAITQRAIRRSSARLPVLGGAEVRDTTLVLDRIGGDSLDPAALRAALEDLFLTTMDVLASLIGADLVTALLSRIGAAAAHDEGARA